MRPAYPLLAAQFLSAFADNAILFTVIAMVLSSGSHRNPGGVLAPAPRPPTNLIRGTKPL